MKAKIIDRAACEWYGLKITTLPSTDPTAWEASFNAGATYITAKDIDLYVDDQLVACSAWLVAGPDYAGAESPDFTTAVKTTFVKIRLIDNPETVIRSAPNITTQLL